MLKITYFGTMKHVDQNGIPCHGPGCSTCLPAHAIETGISDGCCALVKQQLLVNPKATYVELVQ
eukprot:scaffold243356_cov15-Tisochrysis_lutea.AAC.1